MSMLTRSFSLAALVACLGTAPLLAQHPSSKNFQWYVGGHGGIMSLQANGQSRGTLPVAGADLLITARRTALLVSVEHVFGDNELASYNFVTTDSTGAVIASGSVPANFTYVRKYSAMLLAFPVRSAISPFLGIGGGILHAGGFTVAPDDEFAKDFGSHGFGSVMAGLEIRVSRLTAFGQYQVTTGPGTKSESFTNATSGETTTTFGHLLNGPTHTFTAGLRISLGSARETY